MLTDAGFGAVTIHDIPDDPMAVLYTTGPSTGSRALSPAFGNVAADH